VVRRKLGTAIVAVLVVLASLMVSSCISTEVQQIEVTRLVPEAVEITVVVPQTVIATQIVQVVVTAPPEPATSTPESTSTPEFKQWTSSQVIEAFKAAGLEVENPRAMTKDDYGMAPMLAIEGTRFLIPSLCPDCGGRVLSFSSQEDLETTKAYYIELGRSSAAFFSWVFTKDNILVQINGELPEETAKQYEAALAILQ